MTGLSMSHDDVVSFLDVYEIKRKRNSGTYKLHFTVFGDRSFVILFFEKKLA